MGGYRIQQRLLGAYGLNGCDVDYSVTGQGAKYNYSIGMAQPAQPAQNAHGDAPCAVCDTYSEGLFCDYCHHVSFNDLNM